MLSKKFSKLEGSVSTKFCILQDKEVINNWAYALERIMHGSPSGLDNTVCTFGALIEMNRNTSQTNGKTFNILHNSPEIRILLIDTGNSVFT